MNLGMLSSLAKQGAPQKWVPTEHRMSRQQRATFSWRSLACVRFFKTCCNI